MKKFFLILVLALAACGPLAYPKNTPTTTPLVIPVFPKQTFAPTATPIIVTPTPTVTPKMPDVYVVQPGDTLAAIAVKFGLDVNDLTRINQLVNPNFIFPGDVLILSGKLFGPDEAAPAPTPDILQGKEIVVVIHTQRVYAFENGILLKTFVVSTGVAAHPTVIGHFQIYVKYRYTRMTDHATYDLPNVPYTMYFYQGYGLHGTYWHHNFGFPMSHGCVNMKTDPDAKWLYDWAPIGTVVWVTP